MNRIHITTLYLSLLCVVSFALSSCVCCSSDCDNDQTATTACFPDKASANLEICLADLKIRCPENNQGCYTNYGDFYDDAWAILKNTVDLDYDVYIQSDPLVTGVFIDPNNGGQQNLPQCNVPPPPMGMRSINKNNVHLASINELNANDGETISKGDLLFYALNTSAITISLLEYNVSQQNTAFDSLFNHYEGERVDHFSNLIQDSFVAGKFNIMGQGNVIKSAKMLELAHGTEFVTYIIEVDNSTILRIRFQSSKITKQQVDGLIKVRE